MKRTWSIVLLVGVLFGSAALPIYAKVPSTSRANQRAQDVVVLYDDGRGKVIWQDGDWVRRTHTEPLADAYTLTLQGRWDGRACVFEYEETVKPDSVAPTPADYVIVEREIGRNNKTCQMELEGGKRPISSSDLETMTKLGTGGSTASVTGSRAMWQKLAHVDPINLEVSWTKAGQSYSWNGICVTSQYNLLGVHGWASGTGWFSELFQKTSSGLTCSRMSGVVPRPTTRTYCSASKPCRHSAVFMPTKCAVIRTAIMVTTIR